MRRLQDFRDLVRLQERVDGIGDAGGLGPEQRHESIWHQRQQEAHDLAWTYAQRMKHVGGLRDAADEIAVADHEGLVGRIGVGEEFYRGRVRIVRGAELDRLIGARCGDTVGVGGFLEIQNLGVAGKIRIVVADHTIEQMHARHFLRSLRLFRAVPSCGPRLSGG